MLNNFGFNNFNGYSQQIPSKQDLEGKRSILLNQLNSVENQLNQYNPPQQNQQIAPINGQELQRTVESEVKKQLTMLQNQMAARLPDSSLLEAMGAVLKYDDQIWLKDNLSGLPKFLSSEDGKGIVELLVETYRKTVK